MSKQYMVGGGTITFVSSSPPLDMDLSRWVLVSLRGYPFFVTFCKKFRETCVWFHKNLEFLGDLWIQVSWHIFFEGLFASF